MLSGSSDRTLGQFLFYFVDPGTYFVSTSSSVRIGGNGIEKRGVATTHRCILRCLTQLGFEAFSVATMLSIALWSGLSLSLWSCSLRVKAEQSKKRLRFCSFVLFFLPVPVQIRIHQPIFVQKIAELNQTALSVGEIFLVPSGRLVLEEAINVRIFLGLFLKKVSERYVLSDFFTQNYSSPVHCWWNSMNPRVSMLMNNAEFCAVFIVRRGLVWSTSTCRSLLLFLFLGFFRTVKRGEVYSPAEIFFFCPVRVFSNVSTDVQARKHTALFVPVLNVRDAIDIRFASQGPGSGRWPGRGKARPNACLVRQIRSWGSTWEVLQTEPVRFSERSASGFWPRRVKVHTNMCEPKVSSANRKLIFGFIFGSASSDGEATGDFQDFGGNPVALESQSDKVVLARKNVSFHLGLLCKAVRGGTDHQRGSSRTVLHEGE